VTPEQLAAVKIGDDVTLIRHTTTISKGRVTQTTPRWFMVMWQDGTPEVIRRTPSIMTDRLHLDVATKHQVAQPEKRVYRMPYTDN